MRNKAQNETLLLEYLGKSPTLRIVDFFIDNPPADYSKNEIVRSLAMSRATFFKYWQVVEKSGAVKKTRQIGRATLYRLDRENRVVKQLVLLDSILADEAMLKAKEEHQKPLALKPLMA